MAQVRYRANLSAKDFVYSSQDWGRSVIMKQFDQNFSRQIVSPTDPDKDIGIPQIFYCHNVMPCAQGFQSVGYVNSLPATGVAGTAWQWLRFENNSGGVSGYFLITLTASTTNTKTFNIYTQTPGITLWVLQQTVTISTLAALNRFTCAYVNGLAYLLVPQTQCYSFDGNTWTAVTLTGLTIGQINGLAASFGYMIAWSSSAVAWSSTLSATDFTPSLITGAGGGSVQGLQGNIITCVHHTFGFIVFSDKNCVAAVYSGNARYPFNFREVIGGGGIVSGVDLTSLDSESGNLYSYTSSGLQIVSVTQAQVVYPELTNFISGSRFEDFNDGTLSFVETDVTPGSFNKQIAVISNRYLVISYSITATSPVTYTHAIVYDIAMKRWGKLKFTHVQAVEAISNPNVPASARTNLALLDPSGNVQQVDFSQAATSGGTIFLGRYQHSRDRLITLQQVDVSFTQQSAALPTLNVFSTYDGYTFIPPVAVPALSATNAPQYPCRLTGMNHSLCFQGIFMFRSLMLTYSVNGRR